ncbi:MAG: hypothetical protein FWC70_10805 [Defluviitaleaceae bacterium]|nr:hypothetical protein [Defluviitaleaceae bacterium]
MTTVTTTTFRPDFAVVRRYGDGSVVWKIFSAESPSDAQKQCRNEHTGDKCSEECRELYRDIHDDGECSKEYRAAYCRKCAGGKYEIIAVITEPINKISEHYRDIAEYESDGEFATMVTEALFGAYIAGYIAALGEGSD